MALLQYLVPTLATLLVSIFGVRIFSGAPTPLSLSWMTLLIVFVLTLNFDRSRGRWISYVLFMILAVFTAGLYVENSLEFVAWLVAAFLSVSLIMVVSQVRTHPAVRLLLILYSAVLVILPALLSQHIFSQDEAAYIVPTVAISFSLIPLLLQYWGTSRPHIVWPLLSIQQFVLKVSFLVWSYLWKPFYIDTELGSLFREPLLWGIGFLVLILNIKVERLSWPHISLTTYSLFVIFAGLLKTPDHRTLIFVLVALSAFGTIFPSQSLSSDDEKASGLCAVEVGGLGGATFLLSMWILYKMKTEVGAAEFVSWSLFIALVSSKIWGQSQRYEVFGRTSKEMSKKYYVGRLAVQIIAFLFVLGILLNQKLNFYIG